MNWITPLLRVKAVSWQAQSRHYYCRLGREDLHYHFPQYPELKYCNWCARSIADRRSAPAPRCRAQHRLEEGCRAVLHVMLRARCRADTFRLVPPSAVPPSGEACIVPLYEYSNLMYICIPTTWPVSFVTPPLYNITP
jgi:hypothetical protein